MWVCQAPKIKIWVFHAYMIKRWCVPDRGYPSMIYFIHTNRKCPRKRVS